MPSTSRVRDLSNSGGGYFPFAEEGEWPSPANCRRSIAILPADFIGRKPGFNRHFEDLPARSALPLSQSQLQVSFRYGGRWPNTSVQKSLNLGQSSCTLRVQGHEKHISNRHPGRYRNGGPTLYSALGATSVVPDHVAGGQRPLFW